MDSAKGTSNWTIAVIVAPLAINPFAGRFSRTMFWGRRALQARGVFFEL